MPGTLKQSQTAQPILIGPVILASDHISPATGKTLTVTISKNGGAFASPAGAVTEIGSGWYKIAGNATDAATLGPLAIHVTEASIDPYDDVYQVVAYDPQSAAAFMAGVNGVAPPANWNLENIDASGRLLLQPTQTGVTIPTVTTLTNAPADSSGVTSLLSRLTAARAGYLDNLNVGGAVASHADVLAINTSSSKHIILTTVGQYERPESGSTVYTVEARTYSAADGTAVNADSTPTLTATGQTSGSLAANLSAATNPATGVYRWTYTVQSNATAEPIRFDVSATIAAVAYTLSAYTQVVDEVSQTWTSTDASHLTAIFNKLPANNIADETLVLAAIAAIPSAPTAAQNAAAMLDLADGVEVGLTPRQAFRLMAAAAAGKLSGAATTTIIIRNAVADSKPRITATVDASGNRSAITTDLT